MSSGISFYVMSGRINTAKSELFSWRLDPCNRGYPYQAAFSGECPQQLCSIILDWAMRTPLPFLIICSFFHEGGCGRSHAIDREISIESAVRYVAYR